MLNVPTVYAPVIQAVPRDCNFGKVPVGNRVTARILIANHDGCDLHVSQVWLGDSADSAFSLTSAPGFPMVVESECSTDVAVTFCPTHGGEVRGSLEISSDDPIQPVVCVALHGVGVRQA